MHMQFQLDDQIILRMAQNPAIVSIFGFLVLGAIIALLVMFYHGKLALASYTGLDGLPLGSRETAVQRSIHRRKFFSAFMILAFQLGVTVAVIVYVYIISG